MTFFYSSAERKSATAKQHKNIASDHVVVHLISKPLPSGELRIPAGELLTRSGIDCMKFCERAQLDLGPIFCEMAGCSACLCGSLSLAELP